MVRFPCGMAPVDFLVDSTGLKVYALANGWPRSMLCRGADRDVSCTVVVQTTTLCATRNEISQ
jgi:hypothetical protein